MNVEDELYEVQSSDVQYPESGDQPVKRAKLTAYEIEGRKMLALERLADEQRTANILAAIAWAGSAHLSRDDGKDPLEVVLAALGMELKS